jgi:hypothetical protein
MQCLFSLYLTGKSGYKTQPYTISLTLKKPQQILNDDMPMDIETFNLVIRKKYVRRHPNGEESERNYIKALSRLEILGKFLYSLSLYTYTH